MIRQKNLYLNWYCKFINCLILLINYRNTSLYYEFQNDFSFNRYLFWCHRLNPSPSRVFRFRHVPLIVKFSRQRDNVIIELRDRQIAQPNSLFYGFLFFFFSFISFFFFSFFSLLNIFQRDVSIKQVEDKADMTAMACEMHNRIEKLGFLSVRVSVEKPGFSKTFIFKSIKLDFQVKKLGLWNSISNVFDKPVFRSIKQVFDRETWFVKKHCLSSSINLVFGIEKPGFRRKNLFFLFHCAFHLS